MSPDVVAFGGKLARVVVVAGGLLKDGHDFSRRQRRVGFEHQGDDAGGGWAAHAGAGESGKLIKRALELDVLGDGVGPVAEGAERGFHADAGRADVGLQPLVEGGAVGREPGEVAADLIATRVDEIGIVGPDRDDAVRAGGLLDAVIGVAGDPYYGVQQPACSHSVIAVGAHNSDFVNAGGNEIGGNLAWFSTYGPTLDERLKPNISAPGISVESSLSSFRDGSYTVTEDVEFEGTLYEFARLSGTSMSSPATAGVVALMLEANPALTPAEVMTILEETARDDDDTGELPPEGDHVWGHGKVTATAAVLAAWATNGLTPTTPSTSPHFTAYPIPAHDRIRIDAGAMAEPVDWVLIDLQGRPVQRGTDRAPFEMELNGLAAGVHLLHLRQGQHTEVIRIAKAH